MKFLLITPPCFDLFQSLRPSAPKSPPLGLAYIAAMLEKKNIEVEILDTFSLDLDWKQIKSYIKDSDADVFGATCLTTTLREVTLISKIVKKFHPKSIFIVGGSHPTAEPEDVINKNNSIDIAFIGEGEYTILEFCELIIKNYNHKEPFFNQNTDFYHALSKINGICYRDKKGLSIRTVKRPFIENLDDLPLPAYHLLPMEKYRPPSKFPVIQPYATIITARGCPFNCTFCAAKTICGQKLRTRSLDNIRSEINLLKKNYGVRYIWINDSTFTIKSNRVLEIGKILHEFNIKWACNARVDYVTPQLLKYMKYFGCNLIEYGFESGLDRILRSISKRSTVSQNKQAAKWTKEAKILISGDFIIGIPGESVNDVKRTLKFSRNLNLDFISLSILTPYPGTEIYDDLKKKGNITTDFLNYQSPKYFTPVIELKDINKKTLKNLWILGNLEFYFRFEFIINLVKNILLEPRIFISVCNDIKTGFLTIIMKLFKR